LRSHGNTTGVKNTFVGAVAGASNTTGNSNVAIGFNTSFSTVSAEEQIVLGTSATGHGNGIAVIGNTSISGIEPGGTSCNLGSTCYR
jgi:hypothetical protein